MLLFIVNQHFPRVREEGEVMDSILNVISWIINIGLFIWLIAALFVGIVAPWWTKHAEENNFDEDEDDPILKRKQFNKGDTK